MDRSTAVSDIGDHGELQEDTNVLYKRIFASPQVRVAAAEERAISQRRCVVRA